MLQSLMFTRLFAAVIIANVLTLAVCNLIEPKVYLTAFFYGISLAVALSLLQSVSFKRTEFKISKWMVLLITVFWVVVSAPRGLYLMEWIPIPGNVVLLSWDDYAHVAELVSMTASDTYPLKHPSNDNYLLSFYYASFYPIAVIKMLAFFLTIKDALFFGLAFCNLLFAFSLLEIINLLLPSRRSMRVMLFFCIVFGGLDYIFGILADKAVIASHERWQEAACFHGNNKIYSFYFGLQWAPHHIMAFYTCIVAFVLFRFARFARNWLKAASCGLLLISSFYSSVFSFMPAILYIIVEWRTILPRYRNPALTLALLTLLATPLFIYTGKLTSVGFVPATFRFDISGNVIIDKLLTFPLWIVFISVVELGGLPLLSLFSFRRFTQLEKRYYIASIFFFLSTYVIAFSGANNYSFAGMLLPTFVLFFLFAKYWPHSLTAIGITLKQRTVLLTAVIFLLSIGNILSFSSNIVHGLGGSSLAWKMIKRSIPPPSVLKDRSFDRDYRKLARDRSFQGFSHGETYNHEQAYNAEKFLRNIPTKDMEVWEMELLRLPRGL